MAAAMVMAKAIKMRIVFPSYAPLLLTYSPRILNLLSRGFRDKKLWPAV